MAADKEIKTRGVEQIKILIADDDWQSARRTHEFLTQNGFDCRMVQTGAEAKKMLLSSWHPRVLLVDLMLPEGNAFELLNFLGNERSLKDHSVATLVMSGHNNELNVREAYERGARDYLARPIMYQHLLSRIVFHCRDQREIEKINGDAEKDSLKIADIVIAQALQNVKLEEMLYKLTQMAALKVRGARCSVVRQMTYTRGLVLASSDKKDIAGLELDLTKYPEIQLVVNTGKAIVIDDLGESKALSKIKSAFKEIDFNSMVVCPLYFHHKPFGVLSMRMPPGRAKVDDHDLYFIEYMAKVISLYLSTQNLEALGKYGLISA